MGMLQGPPAMNRRVEKYHATWNSIDEKDQLCGLLFQVARSLGCLPTYVTWYRIS